MHSDVDVVCRTDVKIRQKADHTSRDRPCQSPRRYQLIQASVIHSIVYDRCTLLLQYWPFISDERETV